MDITELLAFTAQQNASDLHLSAGLPPMIRVDGDIRRINVPPMDHAQVQGLIYDIMNTKVIREVPIAIAPGETLPIWRRC